MFTAFHIGLRIVMAATLTCWLMAPAFGQQGGGGFGGGGTGGGFPTGGTGGGFGSTVNPGGGVTSGSTITTGGTGTTGSGGGTRTSQVSGGNGALDLSQSSQMAIAPTVPAFEDLRNQGFVGVTAQGVQERGFVGSPSQSLGGSSVGTWGGGVNSSGGAGGAAGGRAPARTNLAGRNSMGVLGGVGSGNGFEVARRGVRAGVINSINFTPVSAAAIESRFQDKMSLLPAAQSQNIGGAVVRIENGTAFVSGIVDSQQAADLLINQLRLEPGVYRIDNQLNIRN